MIIRLRTASNEMFASLEGNHAKHFLGEFSTSMSEVPIGGNKKAYIMDKDMVADLGRSMRMDSFKIYLLKGTRVIVE